MSQHGIWIYRAEVKGIQEWILASDRLTELKGGSAIVDGLAASARRLLQHVGGGKLVSAAAGAVEVAFSDSGSLARFAAVWPMAVEAQAPGLSLVQAWAPEGDPSLYEALGAQRNLRPITLPEAGPLSARSGRTGAPAVRGGHRDGLEDATVAAKLRAPDGELEKLVPEGFKFVSNADDLGDRYLAVIHADGNNVGRLVQSLAGNLDGRRKFSEGLKAATQQAARRAFAKVGEWQGYGKDVGAPMSGEEHALRLRPVVVGGDDITVIVDARYAFDFCELLLRSFEEETAKNGDINGGKPLTACAGVAFVKTGYPFHAAHKLAESLCTAAKEGLRSPGAATPSGILFHRVTTASGTTEWRDLVAGELRIPRFDSAGKPIAPGVLAAGPYSLPQLRALRQFVQGTLFWPRKSFREWVGLLRTDPSRAQARWTRALEVAGRKTREAFEGELLKIGHDPVTGWHAEQLNTAIGDALLWRSLDPESLNSPRSLS